MPASIREHSLRCASVCFLFRVSLARQEGKWQSSSNTSAYPEYKPVARRRQPGCWAGCAACGRQQLKLLPVISSSALRVAPQLQDAHSERARCQIVPALHCNCLITLAQCQWRWLGRQTVMYNITKHTCRDPKADPSERPGGRECRPASRRRTASIAVPHPGPPPPARGHVRMVMYGA